MKAVFLFDREFIFSLGYCVFNTVYRKSIGRIRDDSADVFTCNYVGRDIAEAEVSNTYIFTHVVGLLPLDATLEAVYSMEAENALDKYRYGTESRPTAEIGARGAVSVLV
jgi:hypothetical protein